MLLLWTADLLYVSKALFSLGVFYLGNLITLACLYVAATRKPLHILVRGSKKSVTDVDRSVCMPFYQACSK